MLVDEMVGNAIHFEPIFIAIIAAQREAAVLRDEPSHLTTLAVICGTLLHQATPSLAEHPLPSRRFTQSVAVHKRL